MKFVLFCVILCIAIIAIGMLYFHLQEKTKKKKQKKVAKKAVKTEYNKKCSFLFTKCREKDVSSFDTEEELEILKIIANSYGITDIEEAKKCYEIGKKLVEEKETEHENKVLYENRQKDKREFEDNEKKTKLVGKEKYMSTLERIYNNALKSVNLVDSSKSDIINNEENNPELDQAYEAISTYNILMQKEVEKLDNFHKKICDTTNIEEKFKHLTFSNIKCLVLKSKNVRVSGVVRVDEDLQLLGYNALLDGSIKITILDSDDNELGFGYYSPGTYKDGILVDSGFTKIGKRFSVVCIIKDYEKIDEETTYKYKIEPVNLWLIEC